MRIGIAGGTGAMGRGFACRWARSHDVVVGSRDGARAAEAASRYEAEARAAWPGMRGGVSGAPNSSVAEGCDALVLSIPYANISAVCREALPAAPAGCAVVSPIVPMERTAAGFEYVPSASGGATAHAAVASHMADPSRLVSAFHVISEKKLADLSRPLDYDVFVCGDDEGAVSAVEGLAREIETLRPLRIGGSGLAYLAEMATPLLLNAAARSRLKSPGFRLA